MPAIKTGLGPEAAEIYYETHGDAEAGDGWSVAGSFDCLFLAMKGRSLLRGVTKAALSQGGNQHAGSQTLPGHDHG